MLSESYWEKVREYEKLREYLISTFHTVYSDYFDSIGVRPYSKYEFFTMWDSDEILLKSMINNHDILIFRINKELNTITFKGNEWHSLEWHDIDVNLLLHKLKVDKINNVLILNPLIKNILDYFQC